MQNATAYSATKKAINETKALIHAIVALNDHMDARHVIIAAHLATMQKREEVNA